MSYSSLHTEVSPDATVAGMAGGAAPAPEAIAPGLHARPAANDGAQAAGWKFAVNLDAAELKRGDAVATLLDVLVILPGGRYHTRQLCLILTELFTNALDHGVLRLDPNCKARAGGLEAYLRLKTQALEALDRGTIAISLELESTGREPMLWITMRDSGAGFDYRAPAAEAAPRGRGMALISALCADVEYRGCGNEVRVGYTLGAPHAERLRRMA